jgi:hypothetical protein
MVYELLTKVTSMSYLKSLLHRALNPNASSVPAAPAPQITTLGTLLLTSNSFSLFVILAKISLIGRVDKLF